MKISLSSLLLIISLVIQPFAALSHTTDEYYNRVIQLQEQGQINNAIITYQHALEQDPNHMHTLFNLANLYVLQEQFDDALSHYRKLLAINPNLLAVHQNLAYTLRMFGKADEAMPHYQLILEKNPDATTHYGLAECLLKTGNFEQGWSHFEYRWKRDNDYRNFTEKQWDGTSDIAGKTIFVRTEYGQGDTIQFIRFIPLLKKMGATIIVEAQHTLMPLLSLCDYIDKLIPVQEPVQELPTFDIQVPLMSLPRIFKTTVASIPTNIPYMKADQELVQQWKKRLSTDNNFKIGICWEGSSYYESFKPAISKKAIPLTEFIPITKIKGVSIYSLQKIDGIKQLESLPNNVSIHSFASLDEKHGRFMDTAALIENVDLVISTDTSVAHLAGALGKPVWVLLPYVADWRWMLNCSDSPWYPTMHLFRQTEPGNWASVIQHIITELNNLLDQEIAQNFTDKISTEISCGELIDKITILQIKKKNFQDQKKAQNIQNELDNLTNTYEKHIRTSDQLEKLTTYLLEINKKLWNIEDDIRDKERYQKFDQEFIELARAVYFTNDERCKIKREINDLLGSQIIEEKSYTDYQQVSA